MDRHDLYELCVQSPADLVPFLVALHGGVPRVLAEDFAGTAYLSRTWVASDPERRAIAIDVDAGTIARAAPGSRRLALVCADVRALPAEGGHRADGADIVFAGNFSIGELHARAELLDYFARARARLAPGGIFVCDTYGGESAFRLGAHERRHATRDGAIVHHVFEHRAADPISGEVVNALHFRVECEGEIVQSIRDAFVYRWRLWSLPELRDVLYEAGFKSIEAHARLAETGRPRPLGFHPPSDRLDPSFVVCVVARCAPTP